MTKNWQKRYQKYHPAPQKPKFCMKNIVFFTQKRPPSLAKNLNFAWKNDKKCTKKTTHPRKNWSFAWKKCIFFTQKDHPAPQKAEVLHEKMPKKLTSKLTKKWKTTPKKEKYHSNMKKIHKMTKKVPKRPPSPAKAEVLHEKKMFLYLKRPPSPAKSWSLAWKNAKKLTKKLTKKYVIFLKRAPSCSRNWKKIFLFLIGAIFFFT